MEVRGGNGYIEDWVNSRLIRDAHIGVLWEGTSNINALDVISRSREIRRPRNARACAESETPGRTAAPAAFRAEIES